MIEEKRKHSHGEGLHHDLRVLLDAPPQVRLLGVLPAGTLILEASGVEFALTKAARLVGVLRTGHPTATDVFVAFFQYLAAADEVPAINVTRALSTLTPAELAHVSLGLTHAHDLELVKIREDYVLYTLGSPAPAFVMPGTVTLGFAWQVAECLTEETAKAP